MGQKIPSSARPWVLFCIFLSCLHWMQEPLQELDSEEEDLTEAEVT